MRNNLIPMALAIFLLCPSGAYSQNASHSVEFGLGGTAINHTRTVVSDFHQTSGGDYVFNLEEKHLYGGVSLYSAYELKEWLYADLQGTLGLARYYDSGALKRGLSVLAGPGIQFRPFVKSEWLQPYLRLGVSYYHKSFPAYYFGQFNGDVTKEAIWKAEDSWNKGSTSRIYNLYSHICAYRGKFICHPFKRTAFLDLLDDKVRSLCTRGILCGLFVMERSEAVYTPSHVPYPMRGRSALP